MKPLSKENIWHTEEGDFVKVFFINDALAWAKSQLRACQSDAEKSMNKAMKDGQNLEADREAAEALGYKTSLLILERAFGEVIRK